MLKDEGGTGEVSGIRLTEVVYASAGALPAHRHMFSGALGWNGDGFLKNVDVCRDHNGRPQVFPLDRLRARRHQGYAAAVRERAGPSAG